MRLPSISILSSKLRSVLSSKPLQQPSRRAIRFGAWLVFCLAGIDIAVNFLFAYPLDPRGNAGELSRYFNYGRSLEGKLSQMIGPTDATTASFAVAGWLDPELWKKQGLATQRAAGEDLLVAVYGMSFSAEIGFAVRELDPRIGVRSIAAPAGPPSFSFAAYNLDRGRHGADVVILAMLASSVKALRTLNGMTWQFEAPTPYTYPRYFVQNGRLQAIAPTITSLEQLRAARQDRQRWDAFMTQMQAEDEFFDPFLFRHNWLDQSATIRLIRRAWAQRQQRAIAQRVHDANGFNPTYEIPVLRAIAAQFAATAIADGKLPIVLILNDLGYDDHLFRALQPTLERDAIPYVSTHSMAPATDPTNFRRGGHFTKQANQKIARAVLQLIHTKTRLGRDKI